MTNHEKIPLKIRPHLLSFLYEEMEGKEANYEGTKALSVYFTPKSSLTNYLKNNYTCDRHSLLFLYIKIEKNGLQKTGQVYKKYKGVIEPLLVHQYVAEDFNALIEDLFRISLSFYAKGMIEKGIEVKDALWQIIKKYDLLECGFDYETIRQLYYRSSKRPFLKRLQVQTSNTIKTCYNY
jgi:hypothetical protein